MEWLINLPVEIQIMMAAGVGILMGIIFCWFGEILTPDDIV